MLEFIISCVDRLLKILEYIPMLRKALRSIRSRWKPKEEPQPDHQEAQRQRRREVRLELIKYHKVVHDIGWGAWPGHGENARAAWDTLLGDVKYLERKVIQFLDLDRETAGREWCVDVKDCLAKGWRLVHNCYEQCTLPSGPRLKKEQDEHLRVRGAYEEAYEKVL